MGLDASVYYNVKRLPFDPFLPGVSIEAITGLVDFDDPELYRQFADKVAAVSHRLGNFDLVVRLRTEISAAVGDRVPIITGGVLYDLHCGDFIEVSKMDLLEQELNLLAEATQHCRSPFLERFLNQMWELVLASRAEENPIYFD